MFRTSSPMSNDVLAKYAPSVFAQDAHKRTSERYAFVPTVEIVDGLRQAGWGVYGAGEQRVRNEERRGYQKHILRFRRTDTQLLNIGDSLPEIVLTNSHDASSAFQLHAGLFRLVCSNGLVIADETFSRMSVRHSGKAQEEVLEGSFKVLSELPRIAESVEGMRAVQLDAGEQAAFASAALMARYGEDKAPVEPRQILATRRHNDRDGSLWSTFNAVQENLTRGGIRGARGANGRRGSVRAVHGIDTDTKLNKALWTLAEEMRKLKNA